MLQVNKPKWNGGSNKNKKTTTGTYFEFCKDLTSQLVHSLTKLHHTHSMLSECWWTSMTWGEITLHMHMLIYSSRKFGPLGFGKHCVLFLFLFPCEDERQEEFRTGSKGAGALCSSAGEWAILAGPPYYCYISSTPWLINQGDQLQRDS